MYANFHVYVLLSPFNAADQNLSFPLTDWISVEYMLFFFFRLGVVDTTCGSHMREIIASAVASDPVLYSEALLGKSNEQYGNWILKPDSWGGAIEIAILSEFYGMEIDVVDTVNCIINRFGEDRFYGQRVLLIFDGIHYDPLYLEPLEVFMAFLIF